MKIKEIRLINFLSHENTIFPLDSGLTGIFGEIEGDLSKSNGSGKSSILDAFRYCLYKYSREDKEIDLMRDFADSMKVTVELYDKENVY